MSETNISWTICTPPSHWTSVFQSQSSDTFFGDGFPRSQFEIDAVNGLDKPYYVVPEIGKYGRKNSNANNSLRYGIGDITLSIFD